MGVANYSLTYDFTNENLTSYSKIINFKDKRILSVIGSGDQYFSSLLFGAKQVDLFDCNLTSLNYFYLKFYSIILLNYKEFISYLVLHKKDYYEKIRDYLPLTVKDFYDEFYKSKKIADLFFTRNIIHKKKDYKTSRVIPYLSENNYYELQRLLKKVNFPNLQLINFLDLYKSLNESYDVMIFSNIYSYLNMSVDKYKKILEKYQFYLTDNGIIQAYYDWLNLNHDFNKMGFKDNLIESANYESYIRGLKDNVLVLKKHSN